MTDETYCGCDTTGCGGLNSLGTKCYSCPAYDSELDGRMEEECEEIKQ